MYHKTFQPLRIHAGWNVQYNFFYEAQITKDNIALFEGPTLLIVDSKQRNLLIEISWLPEGDIHGCYVLKMHYTLEVFNPKHNAMERNYVNEDQKPHLAFKSKIKQEIVDKLEDLIWFTEGYEDPRILKKPGEVDEPSESYRIILQKEGLTPNLINNILKDGNKSIQNIVLNHPNLTKEIVLRFFNESTFNKIKNVAKAKLMHKKFR